MKCIPVLATAAVVAGVALCLSDSNAVLGDANRFGNVQRAKFIK